MGNSDDVVLAGVRKSAGWNELIGASAFCPGAAAAGGAAIWLSHVELINFVVIRQCGLHLLKGCERLGCAVGDFTDNKRATLSESLAQAAQNTLFESFDIDFNYLEIRDSRRLEVFVAPYYLKLAYWHIAFVPGGCDERADAAITANWRIEVEFTCRFTQADAVDLNILEIV